uniref:MBL fold metallo-hydrolase n=1 Tax=Fervidicoccus fontis TaxID=683846 RepID=A0A7J3ZKN2_9CREN
MIVLRVRAFRRPLHMYAVDTSPEPAFGYATAYIVPADRRTCVIVDTGPQSASRALSRFLERLDLKPCALLITHVHLDHAGGAGSIASKYDGVEVVVHPRGAKHLVDPSELWLSAVEVLGASLANMYGKPQPVREDAVLVPQDGELLSFGNLSLQVIYTPGHASHHMSFFLREYALMFTGDSAGMLFEELDARIPATPPPFYARMYFDSLEKMGRESPVFAALTHNTVVEWSLHISLHREQLCRWISIAKDLAERGELSTSSLTERLLEADESVRKAFVGGETLYRRSVQHAVRGIVEYVRDWTNSNAKELLPC